MLERELKIGKEKEKTGLGSQLDLQKVKGDPPQPQRTHGVPPQSILSEPYLHPPAACVYVLLCVCLGCGLE